MRSSITLKIIILAFLGFFVLTGLGCKGLSSEQQAATKAVTLEYWTVFDDVDSIRALVNEYRVDHPNINVNVRQLRIDEFYPRLLESLSEDKGPDIISIRNRWIGKLQNKLAAMPPSVPDTLIQTTKGSLGEKTIVTTQTKLTLNADQLDREYLKAVKDDVLVNGKIYGLPLSFDNMVLYYNKDLLDRAGIAEPPKNWSEFQKAVKKLVKIDKNGKIVQAGAALGTGNNVPGSDDLIYLLFEQSGVDFTNKSGRAAFNTTANQSGSEGAIATVMNFYTDFANPTRDTYTWNESMNNAIDDFVNGSLGFFFGYNYHYAQIKARAPQLNFSILPMLQVNPETQVNAANYWVQAVPLKSKKQNEAWGLVTYLTHSPATKKYLDKSVRPTALRAFISMQAEKPELSPFVSQSLIAQNWYRGKDYEAAAQAINTMLKEWLNAPTEEDKVAEWRQGALNRAAQKVNQTL